MRLLFFPFFSAHSIPFPVSTCAVKLERIRSKHYEFLTSSSSSPLLLLHGFRCFTLPLSLSLSICIPLSICLPISLFINLSVSVYAFSIYLPICLSPSVSSLFICHFPSRPLLSTVSLSLFHKFPSCLSVSVNVSSLSQVLLCISEKYSDGGRFCSSLISVTCLCSDVTVSSPFFQ